MWQWRQSSNEEWQLYSDIENAIVETAHQRGDKQVQLDNGVIVDLKKDRHQTNKQSAELRRVSPEAAVEDRQRRSDRFCSAPKLDVKETSSNVPFGAGDWNGSKFVFEWQMRFELIEEIWLFSPTCLADAMISNRGPTERSCGKHSKVFERKAFDSVTTRKVTGSLISWCQQPMNPSRELVEPAFDCTPWRALSMRWSIELYVTMIWAKWTHSVLSVIYSFNSP